MSTLAEVSVAAEAVLVAARRWAASPLAQSTTDLLRAQEALERAVQEYGISSGSEPEYEWVPMVWGNVAVGDHVRAPGFPDSADVVTEAAPVLTWHVDPGSSEYRPRPLETESRPVVLQTRGRMEVRPSAPVEIRREREVSPEHFAAIISLISRELGAAIISQS